MVTLSAHRVFGSARSVARLGSALLLVLVLALTGHVPNAQTPNPNSYCATVQDPNLIMCEDFEAAALHDDVGLGNGGPSYGPWYDDTGIAGARGNNSYWTRKYGSVVNSCAWAQGDPSSPVVGKTCAFGTCFIGEWRADNRWQANQFACVDILRNGEFDDEIATLGTGPSKTYSGTNGVFAGTQSMAHRIGAGQSAGNGSLASWGSTHRTFGITMAAGYAANSLTSGIWNFPWKHNEWAPTNDGIFLFHNTNSLTEQVPFEQFAFHSNQTACNAALAGATIRRGTLECVSVGLLYRPTTTHYRRSIDWPLGTWGCVQGHFQNWGTSNMSVKIWFNNTLIIDFDGFNGTFLHSNGGFNGLMWNSYANANQGGGKSTTQTTYRYEDNIHIRAGAPVSCSQIGYGTTGSTAPSAPTGLRIVG